jgi:two-component system NtrC family response regulator
MRTVVETIERLAPMKHTVLITGESGTGKELLARALHFGGPRANGPFIAVNCAALPSGLIESELFGSAKGAFTGAFKDRAGKIEAADGGTLFLDEVAELPMEVQPKLLRVLETLSVERVGENKLREVDLRLVAATNKDPEALVEKGEFREDLYYRLAVVPVKIPPLRSRPEDIGPLARYLVWSIAGDEAPELTDEAIAALSARPWPGNVRELANVLERTLALHEGGPITDESLFGTTQPLRAAPTRPSEGSPRVTLPAEGAALDDMVRDLLVQALERQRWNQSAAARLLKVPRHVLQYRMEKFGIVPPKAEKR